MKISFCTIITNEYLPFAKTLYDSLSQFDVEFDFYTLIIDNSSYSNNLNFKFLKLSDLKDRDLVLMVSKRYKEDPDALRWSLKPLVLINLLKQGYEKVFYVDPDLYFYSDYSFLFDQLDGNSFLLSPHWGCVDPKVSEEYFFNLLTEGIYNAGFLGVTEKGVDTLYWWANMCLYACEKDRNKGIYDDQAYLNLFPLLNSDSKIITHRGCNVAEWNRFENKRSLSTDGTLLINAQFSLVFIHFSNVSYILESDSLLIPYLRAYETKLIDNGWNGNLIGNAKSFLKRKRLRTLSIIDKIIRKGFGNKILFRWKGWGIDEY